MSSLCVILTQLLSDYLNHKPLHTKRRDLPAAVHGFLLAEGCNVKRLFSLSCHWTCSSLIKLLFSCSVVFIQAVTSGILLFWNIKFCVTQDKCSATSARTVHYSERLGFFVCFALERWMDAAAAGEFSLGPVLCPIKGGRSLIINLRFKWGKNEVTLWRAMWFD